MELHPVQQTRVQPPAVENDLGAILRLSKHRMSTIIIACTLIIFDDGELIDSAVPGLYHVVRSTIPGKWFARARLVAIRCPCVAASVGLSTISNSEVDRALVDPTLVSRYTPFAYNSATHSIATYKTCVCFFFKSIKEQSWSTIVPLSFTHTHLLPSLAIVYIRRFFIFPPYPAIIPYFRSRCTQQNSWQHYWLLLQ
jgi:hypothetical protein